MSLKSRLKSINFWYFGFLIILNLLPIIAPIAKSFNQTWISKPIYFIYSFACHQFHSRSLHLGNHQCAWCARDMGIWGGFLAAAILYKQGMLKKIKWYHLIVFVLPIAIDGLTQTFFTIMNLNVNGSINPEIQYVSNNLVRFITGSFFGVGLSLFITPNVLDSETSNYFSGFKNAIRKIGMTMLGLLVLYFAFIQIWNFTSTNYKPTNLLDSKPKVQIDNFFVRRQNGDCSTYQQENLLALDCFF